MAFLVELAEWPSGEGLGPLAWRSLSLERSLNGGMTAALVVDNTAQSAAYARVGPAVLRVWQDGALRFHGRVREPMAAKPGIIELSAGSPYTLLDRRQLDPSMTGFSWIGDAGDLVAALLSYQNGRSPTGLHLTVGSYPDSVIRERVYDPGKSFQEVIADLAALDDGFYFLESPVRDPAQPQILAELVLRWPDPGTDRTAARFQYGEGTLGNLSGYTLPQLLPLNHVVVSGGPPEPVEGEETEPAPPPAEAADFGSIASWGLFERWDSEPDVALFDELQEKANSRVRGDPVTLGEVEVVASGPAVHAPNVPALWTDYDLGDTVYLTVRDETTQVEDLPLVVVAVRLALSAEDDSEQVELTLQPPGEDVGP